ALGNPDQRSVEAVSPPVVAAANRSFALASAAEQAGGAVTADVAVSQQRVVPVADDEHRLGAGLGGQIAAGTAQRRHMACQLPGPFEDQLVLELQHPRIRVEAGVQGGSNFG